MSSDCGRFPFYAVCRGHVPGVYRSWQECDQHVNGYRNSEHRDFRDLSEAVAWLCNAADPPARQPTRLIQPPTASTMVWAVIPIDREECHVIDVGRIVMEPESSFIHVEDMELMLMQACAFFQIGVPIFVPQEVNSTDNNLLFGFTVFLPHNSKGLDLVAHGYAVRDYNYRVLGRLTEQFNQVNKEEVDRLNERIRSLELENENLRGQVEIFGKMLDE
ncbi:hypothetical protein DS421_20g701430 [Arachis hypogaea]|nr:hypothetical protein DS421_20g701430 [Arachis hypogaea]